MSRLIEKLLAEWSFYREREKIDLIAIIKKFHTKNDYTMDLK